MNNFVSFRPQVLREKKVPVTHDSDRGFSTHPWVYFFAPHLTWQRKFYAFFFQIAEIPQDRVPLYGLGVEENFVLVEYTRCPRGGRDVSTCTRHYARAEFLRKFQRYS